MKVVNLKIANFRSIKNAELKFDGHCLIVGPNNVGKSTVCEALDLVLGPDRISRFPPVEEFDFHNARYFVPSEVEGEQACGRRPSNDFEISTSKRMQRISTQS